MQQPSRAVVSNFERELRLIDPDNLRIVWGQKDHGICRWVIQRRIPAHIHHQCLEDFSSAHPGEDRYFDQKQTDEEGNVIQTIHFDRVPEWALGHVVEDPDFTDLFDDRGYRPPDSRDLAAIKQWLFEFRSVEEQMRVMKDEREQQEQDKKDERVHILAEDIKNARGMWGDPEALDLGRRPAMPGTEI